LDTQSIEVLTPAPPPKYESDWRTDLTHTEYVEAIDARDRYVADMQVVIQLMRTAQERGAASEQWWCAMLTHYCHVNYKFDGFEYRLYTPATSYRAMTYDEALIAWRADMSSAWPESESSRALITLDWTDAFAIPMWDWGRTECYAAEDVRKRHVYDTLRASECIAYVCNLHEWCSEADQAVEDAARGMTFPLVSRREMNRKFKRAKVTFDILVPDDEWMRFIPDEWRGPTEGLDHLTDESTEILDCDVLWVPIES